MPESNTAKLAALLKDIHSQSDDGEGAYVDAKLFLDGNEDEGSIGCNLEDHPGMDAFRKVVTEVSGRKEVSELLVCICEVMEEPSWPFTDSILVCTSAPAKTVKTWFKSLSPDDVIDLTKDDGEPSEPTVEGHKWFSVWWD